MQTPVSLLWIGLRAVLVDPLHECLNRLDRRVQVGDVVLVECLDVSAAFIPRTLALISQAIADNRESCVDLVHSLRYPPAPLPDLLVSGDLHFEPTEPVIDLRWPQEQRSVGLLPVATLESGPWLEPEIQGVWFEEERATVSFDLAEGGQRFLAVECIPARGRRPVTKLDVLVNGVDCGSWDLAPEWSWYRLALPETLVRATSNRITFVSPERSRSGLTRRVLKVRRIALLNGEERDLPALGRSQPVKFDAKREVLTIRRSGWLTVPFTVDDRIDALKLRCRVVGGEGRGQVVVARPLGAGPGRDPPVRKVLEFDQARRTTVRMPLHGLAGGFVLTLQVDLDQDSARLVIDELRLVAEESDPRNRTDSPK